MTRYRYSPRLTGIGKQVVQQVLNKGLMKVILTPALRGMIKKECDCTDADIDRGIEDGTVEFMDEFKAMLVKQRAEMVPPPEDDDGNNLGPDDRTDEINIPKAPKENNK